MNLEELIKNKKINKVVKTIFSKDGKCETVSVLHVDTLRKLRRLLHGDGLR